MEMGVGRREGKKDPGPNLLRALFSGGNLENPFCLLRRQEFIFSAASVILFQIFKAFLPHPLPQNNHFICSGDRDPGRASQLIFCQWGQVACSGLLGLIPWSHTPQQAGSGSLSPHHCAQLLSWGPSGPQPVTLPHPSLGHQSP